MEILSIQGMDSVVQIGQDFYGEGSTAFLSLKEVSTKE